MDNFNSTDLSVKPFNTDNSLKCITAPNMNRLLAAANNMKITKEEIVQIMKLEEQFILVYFN